MGAVSGGGFNGLLFAIVFLALGVAELAVVQRFVYPALRWRFEEAKVTGTQGHDPRSIMTFLRVQALLVLPLVGFLLGGFYG